jgi:hypothetical protein
MKIYNIIFCFIVVLFLNSCRDFDEFQNDPNNTTNANPGLLLTNIEISSFNSIDLNAALASRYLVNVNLVTDAQYYNWDRASFGFYNVLRQVQKMEEEAAKFNNDNYLAIAKFFRVYIFEQMTRQFGDIPFSEALEAEQGNIYPVYDDQKSIYLGILDLLEKANNQLDINGPGITGDVVYDGDLLKWKKLINSYHLRVLMSLSIKEGDPDLNIRDRFNTIFNNSAKYPIMESNEDNCSYTYSEETGNTYPFWRSASITTSYILTDSFINKLKDKSDPRLFVLAAPDNNLSSEDPFSFESYSGLKGSASINENATRLSQGEGSPLDQRYIEDPEAEENLAFGYSELNFIIAEAAYRNWITADVIAFYENGIRASMNFYGIDESLTEAYLNQAEIMYTPATGLEQIITQSYLSMFLNSGWEPFFNNRRTGFPEFDVSGDGVLNQGRVPKRWMYPISEINQNKENLEEAIERQFPDGDNINGIMWSIRP